MNRARGGGRRGGPRAQSQGAGAARPAAEVGGGPAGFAENEERPREIERSHWGGRYLEGDPTGRGVTEVERRRAELTNLFRMREDRRGLFPRLDAGRRIELDEGDGPSVKGRWRGPQRLTPVKGARSGDGVVFVAAHQVLDIAEADVGDPVTLSESQHDRIVRQPHLGVEAPVQRVGQHQGFAAEVALAELLRDQPEAQAAAIRLLQVADHDVFGELIEINGPVATRTEADLLSCGGRAGERRGWGAASRGAGPRSKYPRPFGCLLMPPAWQPGRI